LHIQPAVGLQWVMSYVDTIPQFSARVFYDNRTISTAGTCASSQTAIRFRLCSMNGHQVLTFVSLDDRLCLHCASRNTALHAASPSMQSSASCPGTANRQRRRRSPSECSPTANYINFVFCTLMNKLCCMLSPALTRVRSSSACRLLYDVSNE